MVKILPDPGALGNRRRAIDIVCLARDTNHGLLRRVKTYAFSKTERRRARSITCAEKKKKKEEKNNENRGVFSINE